MWNKEISKYVAEVFKTGAVMRIKDLIITGVVISMLLANVEVNGNIITIGLEGEVTQVQEYAGALEGQVKMGDAIRGYYTYDSSTPDNQPWDTVGQYLHNRAPFGVNIEIGPLIFQSDPINVMFGMGILNNHNGEDSYSWSSYNNLDLKSGLTVEHISWVLYDWSCRALSSDALPTNAPILEDWELNDLLITLGEKGGAGYIQATVTSVEIVPEPASAFIMGVGLALLRLGGRRK